MLIIRLLRQLSLQTRIMGGFIIAAILTGLFIPLSLSNLEATLSSVQNIQITDDTFSPVTLEAQQKFLTAHISLVDCLAESINCQKQLENQVDLVSQKLPTSSSKLTTTQKEIIQSIQADLIRYKEGIKNIQIATNNTDVQANVRNINEIGDSVLQSFTDLVNENEIVSKQEVENGKKKIVSSARERSNNNIIVAVIGIALAFGLMFVISVSITTSVNDLRVRTEIFQRGRLETLIDEIGSDELTLLARTFNKMASQISGLITNLEKRVDERTGELQKRTTDLESLSRRSEMRANQLQAVALVSKAITQIQNIDDLLPQVAEVINKEFGYYHVGIFLVDSRKEFAVLTASNSLGGKRMLSKAHKLRIGQTGIVGYVANTGRPRIALDTGSDSVYFNNPDLPETHSEMALPLRLGTETIGVLDIQSKVSDAFRNEDIEVLTIVAEQVSIAIQNARQFEDAQKAVTNAEEIYRQYLRREWRPSERQGLPLGYRYQVTGVEALTDIPDKMLQKSPNEIAVPIKLRGEIIGILKASGNEDYEWDQDEMDIAEAVAERVALAIENARLLNDSQRQAAKEHTIGELSSKISGSTDKENILRVTVHELSKVLGATEVFFELETEEDTQ